MTAFNAYIDTTYCTAYITRRYPNRLHFCEVSFNETTVGKLESCIASWLSIQGFAGQRVAMHYTGEAS